MNVKLINKGSEGELLLEGRLDSNTAPEVEKLIDSLTSRFDVLTINLQGLLYTSSAGLRIFLMLTKKMNQLGKELYLCNVSPAVMEVLELTGFAGILNFK